MNANESASTGAVRAKMTEWEEAAKALAFDPSAHGGRDYYDSHEEEKDDAVAEVYAEAGAFLSQLLDLLAQETEGRRR